MSNHLGVKVRALRRRENWTQIELAQKLEISPSYLNLIEHNQRPLTAHLLVRVAQLFKVEIDAFADDSQSRLAADLQEVFGDPIFEEHQLTTNDLREIAENSTVSRAIIALYHSYRSSAESTRALAAKLYDGQDFLGLNPAHLPSEEVSDVIQLNMNYFPEMEEVARAVAARAGLDRADRYRSLVDYLRANHGVNVELAPVGRDRAAVRRYDPDRRVLALSEILPPWSRHFQVAHQIGLIEAAPVIDAIIARSQSHLTTAESTKLCRVMLANYFAAALLMPTTASAVDSASLIISSRFR